MKTQTDTSNANDSYQEMVNLLYRAFFHFNQVLVEGELKRPIITISTRGRKNALGWHAPNRWHEGAEERHEINICAERLNRSWDDICETLLHEMAHLWNTQHKIEDCNAAQYHNKHFKTAAEMFGLKVSKMKNKGFALTDLDEKGKDAIKSLGVDEKTVPKIHRKEKRVSHSANSFVLCTHKDKARFQDLAAGTKQVEFFAILLKVYEQTPSGALRELAAEVEEEA